MHLTDERIVSLLVGGADPDGQRHLESCADCGRLTDWWRLRLADMKKLQAESLDEKELHRLRVLFRQLGPRAEGRKSWLATLVRAFEPAAAGVRGDAGGEVLEYTAGPHTIVVQVSSELSRGMSIHGQLLGDCPTEGEGRVVLSAETGEAFIGDVDRFGEFHMDEIPAGRYAATWWWCGDVVTVEELELEGEDGSAS